MDPGANLRYGADVGTRFILALLLVGACQAPPVGHTGFGSMPDVTTAPAVSTGSGSSGSGSSGSSGRSLQVPARALRRTWAMATERKEEAT